MNQQFDPNLKWVALMVGATVFGCCFLVTSCEKRRFEANEKVRWISRSEGAYDAPVTATSEVK